MKLISIILVICSSLIASCNVRVRSRDKNSKKYLCIKGHEYVILNYSAGQRGYGYMAPIFDKNGKPFKCNY